MKRYNKLLAGASWMAEYGNPDVAEDWSFLKKYSPYHNIVIPQSATKYPYPSLLVTTSTKDDRVHPYHARCFVQRLLNVKATIETTNNSTTKESIFYYENIEGGHGGAADNSQLAFMNVRTVVITYIVHVIFLLFDRYCF